MRFIQWMLPLATLAVATGAPSAPDDLDRFVATQMAMRHVPGLSLAIIQGGRIVETRAYGVTASSGARVTPTTLFQAGSISKLVTAAGAMHLVETGRLALDSSVNATLKTWKVPDNRFTETEHVTLRRLLSHTAGVTVHGFGGYAVNAPVPTVTQVLDGAAPANSPPVRVEAVPGSTWSYSGGGYMIVQQMLLDATGISFPEFMRRTVLGPANMTRSTYAQPIPSTLAASAAAGHYPVERAVTGRWHVYPEMAAAGLWTTPTDLARFAIAIQASYLGRSSRLLAPRTTRQMLTEQKAHDGLGAFLTDSGRGRKFFHGGRNEGFDGLLFATVSTGQGVVVMINANDNSGMINRIEAFVARKYKWPGEAAYEPPAPVATPAVTLDSYAGRYELADNQPIALVVDGTRLATTSDGLPDQLFVPVGPGRFASVDRPAQFVVQTDTSGLVTGLRWTENGSDRTVPRIGPLGRTLARSADPDPAFTTRVEAVVRAMEQGDGVALTAPGLLTEQARHDFADIGKWSEVAGQRGLSYLARESVVGRGIKRHAGTVDMIAYYSMVTDAGRRTLLVYLTRDGKVSDFDVVND